MENCFIAICSKAGIVCAANKDKTIHRLSEKHPVAIAVNPDSPIPWKAIIEDFKNYPHFQSIKMFDDYSKDFLGFLSKIQCNNDWRNLDSRYTNIILLGFGKEDIYPIVHDITLGVDAGGHFCINEDYLHPVTTHNSSFFHYMGSFDSIAPLIWGASKDTIHHLYDSFVDVYEEYIERVNDRFKGTKFEEYVYSHLSRFDARAAIADRFDSTTDKAYQELSFGIDSFSIEDMVTAAETMVNANSNLSLIKSSGKAISGATREIAVITIPEGITWIKHSLFFRRNEL